MVSTKASTKTVSSNERPAIQNGERESASRASANVLTPPSELLDSMVQTKVGYRHTRELETKGIISPGE